MFSNIITKTKSLVALKNKIIESNSCVWCHFIFTILKNLIKSLFIILICLKIHALTAWHVPLVTPLPLTPE